VFALKWLSDVLKGVGVGGGEKRKKRRQEKNNKLQFLLRKNEGEGELRKTSALKLQQYILSAEKCH
jgi:hypothetical protein